MSLQAHARSLVQAELDLRVLQQIARDREKGVERYVVFVSLKDPLREASHNHFFPPALPYLMVCSPEVCANLCMCVCCTILAALYT